VRGNFYLYSVERKLIKKYNKKYFTLDDMTELSAELKIKTVNFLFGAENLNIVKVIYRDKHNNIIR
jgi:hypothetical protein